MSHIYRSRKSGRIWTKKEPLAGDMLCEPESAYGIMKLCSCYTTRMLCDKYGMRHIWPRVLSGYGKYDNDGSVLIANIVNSLHHRPLEFSKGEQIWDFVYMDDIANALYLIAKRERIMQYIQLAAEKQDL